MSDIVITPMVVPSHLDTPEAHELRAMVRLGNEMARKDAGIDDLDETVAESLPSWLDQTDQLRAGFIARRGDEIVGAAELSTSTAAGTLAADLALMVPAAEFPGGTAQVLLDRLEHEAASLGRSVLQTWTLHPARHSGGTLTPATGWGSVSSTPMSDLLIARGYALEQVERNSVLPLQGPLEDVCARLEEASAYAGPDYRVVSWSLPTPPPFRTGYAHLIASMITNIPTGDLVTQEEQWDEDKLVRHDERIMAAGQTLSIVAVVHEPSGQMVAFNELAVGEDRAGVTQQWGTLVLGEHRGKRLGTIVKCANLLRWREIAPDSPKVTTFNAEENRPMLGINEAIGFVPASYAGGWQKKLR
ncbi:GNAT family N-acetyltransferase [Microbacterium sp. A196]|uniref:GNAT family N-acetyltransferase n=1 Tax=unclassified Microbacterium TaxID=2609290 RepID=UPI003FCF57A1